VGTPQEKRSCHVTKAKGTKLRRVEREKEKKRENKKKKSILILSWRKDGS